MRNWTTPAPQAARWSPTLCLRVLSALRRETITPGGLSDSEENKSLVIQIPISRRAWLLASAGLIGCGRKKAPRMSGYCFVANQESRSIAVVNLERFRVVRQIPLDAAPSAVLTHPPRPRVLVLAPDTGTVYEVDGATYAISRKVRAGNQAVAM